jgi:hypothetical protein
MINQLFPNRRYRRDEQSPFSRPASTRPLALTIHCPPEVALSDVNRVALEAIRELGRLESLEIADTSEGDLPTLRLTRNAINREVAEVGLRRTLVSPRDFSERLAFDLGEPELIEDLRIADAHRALGNDILVTSSAGLLANRQASRLSKFNLRTPIEAVKIVGLYLRDLDNYTLFCDALGSESVDRLIFYWVLTRERLPSMWRYFSACVAAGLPRTDDLLDLGSSILRRCQRALEARDAIGVEFYRPQGNDTREKQIYHFDYLTLLLVGSLDAQARVAWRAYGITSPGERSVNFWKAQFLKALSTRPDAQQLHTLVTGDDFLAFKTLLVGLRNTIHGAGLRGLAYQTADRPQASLFSVPPSDAEEIRLAAVRLGGLERWGLTEVLGLQFEPYAYATSLVDEGLRAIDAIALATAVERLLPPGTTVSLQSGPPDRDEFQARIRDRIALLG